MSFILCEKRTAILDATGHILITGGPGSGKTTIALMKSQKVAAELLPGQQIIFLSFSRAAVAQIIGRRDSMLSAVEQAVVRVHTYHSFFLELVVAHGALVLGMQPRIVFPDEEALLRSQFGGDWKAEKERLCWDEGVVCFDMFAPVVARLVTRSVSLAGMLADKHPLVIVDEFQDTDNDQWDVVKAISLRSSVVVLADPDQRIFEYRGNVDPLRLDQLREHLDLQEFDFTGDNHRSPNSSILAFANAILHNQPPLPVTTDVRQVGYYPLALGTELHSTIRTMEANLLMSGIDSPSIAVFTRTNRVVSQLSILLSETQYSGSTVSLPIEHDVIWDSNTAAAAALVVCSILEWRLPTNTAHLALTLKMVSQYYSVKDATSESKSAKLRARQYRDAATAVREGKILRIQGARLLQGLHVTGIAYAGRPASDWRTALSVLDVDVSLSEISKAARMVRLFRMTDELSTGLSELWQVQMHYDGAIRLMKATIQERMVSDSGNVQGKCVLMSLHKSKGKEFDGVILVEKQYWSEFFHDRDSGLSNQESRQLLRVGITRARKQVALLRPYGARSLVGP